ncbi:carbohydrate kinase family protein [Paracoccus sp. JM45]|uniref:carbohydrate kinase family protein n=1 Tax=Paracoccus sp. JM45 TaxID=2283626 RepID=UPI0015FFED01|nr:sugar kinase [Paracoccus sp. JM45]
MSNNPVIVTAGEILVEFVSHRQNCGLARVGEYSGPYPSGAPAIFLDQAARMGAATVMIGGVGNDGFGRCVLDRLEANGVGTSGVTVNDGMPTGVAFVSYYSDGNRDFIHHMTGNAADHFTAPAELFDPANAWLHVSAASLGNAKMRDVIMDLVHQVDNAGGKIICDPNARPALMDDDVVRTALAEVIERAYCLMPSTSDLGFLFPDVDEDAAVERLFAENAKILVIKRGADGITVVSGDERYDLAGHPVDEIDPTGAGDCFCGTFVSLLAQGASLETAGIQANAAGAIAVTRRGPMEGNSSPAEIADFLEQAKPETVA